MAASKGEANKAAVKKKIVRSFENLISEIAPNKFHRLCPHGTFLGEYTVNFKAEATAAQKKSALVTMLNQIFDANYKDGKKTVRIEFEWFFNKEDNNKYVLRAYRVGKAKATRSKPVQSVERTMSGDEESTTPGLEARMATATLQTDPVGPILSPPNSVSTIQSNTLLPVTEPIEL